MAEQDNLEGAGEVAPGRPAIVEKADSAAGHGASCADCSAGSCGYHCGARNRQPEENGLQCSNRAGFKTDHVGIGHCHLHGGNTSAQRIQAQRVMAANAVATFGLAREIDPQQALLEEVHRTAGHVAWLGTKIAAMSSDDDLKQLDAGEKFERPAVWIEMYEAERKHLVRVSAEAIRCGIAERQVRLAEEQGHALATVLRDVLGAVFDLLIVAGVEAELVGRIKQDDVPGIVRRHLMAVVDASSEAIPLAS